MPKALPPRPSLEHLKKQAKVLLKSFKSSDSEAVTRFQASLPRFSSASQGVVRASKTSLQEAQLVIAREYGFDDWQKLAAHVAPSSLKPRPHRRMIVPREWQINTPTLNYDTGITAGRTITRTPRGYCSRGCRRDRRITRFRSSVGQCHERVGSDRAPHRLPQLSLGYSESPRGTGC